MAICRVVKQTVGWNAGDEIEVKGSRLTELIDEGVVIVLKADEVPEVKPVVELSVAEKPKRKKVK